MRTKTMTIKTSAMNLLIVAMFLLGIVVGALAMKYVFPKLFI